VSKEAAPTDKNPWSREKFQREAILSGVQDAPDDAIIMISDVDEIPDMAKVPFEKMPAGVLATHMYMFNYSFDYMFVEEPWVGTVVTTLDLARKWTVNYFRDNRWKFPVIQYAGWHLSSFGDAEHIANKYKTYAHALDKGNHPRLTDPTMIDVWLKQGIHSDGKTSLVPRPPNVPLPPQIKF
jgi:beta-1,4-mannosyl-glycoprotein beta-1,4-N-acetylglucosaminyltransferase